MTGRYGDIDYSRWTKGGALLGLSLFAVGALGELAIHAAGLQLPAWEAALLFNAEIIGVLLFVITPLVFGVLLPLTE